jgi:hypothetical protein
MEVDRAMYIINVRFESIREVGLEELLGATGVYVLWPSEACASPRYIGEGKLVDRINAHSKAFPLPTGVIARTDIRGQDPKHDAAIVEDLLLQTCDHLGCRPTHNSAGGKNVFLSKTFERHGVVRLNVTGMNPFAHPSRRGARLRERREIVARDEGDHYTIETTFRRSR